MVNKQTAVEFLQQTLWEQGEIDNFDWEQAIAMEKQQIMDAYMDSYGNTTEPEDYYNQTYGK